MPRPVFPAFVRTLIPVAGAVGAFASNDARVLADSVKLGFRCWIESLVFVLGPVAGAGAGGTQTFKLRKGGTTGDVIATLTVAVDDATVGKFTEALVAAADGAKAYIGDTDTFSITRDAGGTTFSTEPLGQFYVKVRQHPQARV